jgi:hypothetical protein
MTRSTLERLAPLTGIVFVLLVVIAFVVSGEPPDSDDSTEEVVSFWTENDGEQIAGAIIGGWAAVFLVWFAGSLRATLKRAEGEPGRLAAIAFGGFLLLALGILAFSGFQFAAGETAGDVPDEVTQTLSVLNADFFIPLAAGNVIALLATGVAIVRHGGLPRWLGWVAIVLGIASLTPVGFFAFLIGGIWVLVISVLIYLGDRSPAAASPPA